MPVSNGLLAAVRRRRWATARGTERLGGGFCGSHARIRPASASAASIGTNTEFSEFFCGCGGKFIEGKSIARSRACGGCGRRGTLHLCYRATTLTANTACRAPHLRLSPQTPNSCDASAAAQQRHQGQMRERPNGKHIIRARR